MLLKTLETYEQWLGQLINKEKSALFLSKKILCLKSRYFTFDRLQRMFFSDYLPGGAFSIREIYCSGLRAFG